MTRLATLSQRIARRAAAVELGLAVALALAAAALWAFAELAEEVMEGETRAFDTAILLALRIPGDAADPLGPPWLEEMARDVTGLGGLGVLTFLTLAAAGLLWLQRKHGTALYVLAAVGSGVTLSNLAKAFFDRPRPDLVPHGSLVYTASFPSGHSLMAAVVYLTLAALVARNFRERRLRAYVVALAVLVTLAVGASRVYLGVHWPTDVLAGWAAGGAWALACAALARTLARRGAIEPADDGPAPG
ncbi:MAG: phosphatase PAP2 family protein [Rhodobacteraceae bacterium]|jgi:undecaprenyl-diphosphatase|uniref:phosphatase PAP2 family protein n=1 Tax=Albidovulum sp. TaxID=1872424 RepID=UPI001D6D5CD0|nr:phosphatase PAP2 family protein [uncultured Defluviimonas sp.]MCB2124852.1 phosphatase PAP2 family protein [Paracoccaceae bacterium]MCC0069356.1 phosphatase PAP2 family protein [Paracoccaceae bacterium]